MFLKWPTHLSVLPILLHNCSPDFLSSFQLTRPFWGTWPFLALKCAPLVLPFLGIFPHSISSSLQTSILHSSMLWSLTVFLHLLSIAFSEKGLECSTSTSLWIMTNYLVPSQDWSQSYSKNNISLKQCAFIIKKGFLLCLEIKCCHFSPKIIASNWQMNLVAKPELSSARLWRARFQFLVEASFALLLLLHIPWSSVCEAFGEHRRPLLASHLPVQWGLSWQWGLSSGELLETRTLCWFVALHQSLNTTAVSGQFQGGAATTI